MLRRSITRRVDQVLTEPAEDLIVFRARQLQNDREFPVRSLITCNLYDPRWRECRRRGFRNEHQHAFALVIDSCV